VKFRIYFFVAFALGVLYLSAAAYVLRFQIDRLLFPHVPATGSSTAQVTHPVTGRSGNVMLVRGYGAPQLGCLVFFPGQHGGISAYEKSLFPHFVANGIAVFALAYPGQDGAPGRSELAEVQELVQKALSVVGQTCPLRKTVFVGRSLGAMLAAYAAGLAHPAGLVLEATAPSLSSAVMVRLHSRWYLWPIAQLPVARLLAHDYTLGEGLPASAPFPVVVFQGTADEQTPITSLRAAGALPTGARVVAVDGGTHANTYLLAIEPYVQAVLRMLRPE
jgi:alpha-beta hydrolase superfamily lysophospholipase